MEHALCAFNKPVPADAVARKELMLRALYRSMKEDNFDEAYRLVAGDSELGDGAGEGLRGEHFLFFQLCYYLFQ